MGFLGGLPNCHLRHRLNGLELAGLSPQALGIPRDLSASTESVLGWQALATVLSPMGAGDDLKSSGLLCKCGTNWAASPAPTGSLLCSFFLCPILCVSIWCVINVLVLPNTDPHCEHLCLLLCPEDHFGSRLCLAQHYYHLFTSLGIYDATCLLERPFSSSLGMGDKNSWQYFSPPPPTLPMMRRNSLPTQDIASSPSHLCGSFWMLFWCGMWSKACYRETQSEKLSPARSIAKYTNASWDEGRQPITIM